MLKLKEWHNKTFGTPPTGGGRSVGGWMRFHCGDKVFNKADPRHVGEVTAIRWGVVRVRWDETGWLSDVPVNELERAR